MTTIAYEFIPIKENNDPLVVLSSKDFVLDPVYFIQGLSQVKEMYLRKSVVKKLLKIQKKLEKYKFKIWDAQRSREVQENIYNKFRNELKAHHPDWDEKRLEKEVTIFVTIPNNPHRIPPHSTGGTIDLTLVDNEGNEVDMGTSFDHFGPESEPLYYEKNDSDDLIKNNRKLLRDAMYEEGFTNDNDEWWHFDYGNQSWAVKKNKEWAFFGETYV